MWAVCFLNRFYGNRKNIFRSLICNLSLITLNISSNLKNAAFLLTPFSTFYPLAVVIMRRHAVPDLSSALL